MIISMETSYVFSILDKSGDTKVRFPKSIFDEVVILYRFQNWVQKHNGGG